MAKKTYVLDTSVYLTDSNCINSFGNNDIVVLKVVFYTQMAFNRLKKALKYKIVNFDGTCCKNTMVMIDNHTLSEKKIWYDFSRS